MKVIAISDTRSPGGDYLTPKVSLKRKPITTGYVKQIDAMDS